MTPRTPARRARPRGRRPTSPGAPRATPACGRGGAPGPRGAVAGRTRRRPGEAGVGRGTGARARLGRGRSGGGAAGSLVQSWVWERRKLRCAGCSCRAYRRGHGRDGLHTAGDGADGAAVTRFADIPDLVLGPLAGRPEADWYRAPPGKWTPAQIVHHLAISIDGSGRVFERSEEHTSELQSRLHLVCRLLLEK